MKQNISKYASRTVGEIVADNYAAADVFHHFGVDFCCHGADNYLEAVGKANADPERVADALDGLHAQPGTSPDFKQWPTDLLIDYVLKIHHRGIRRDGPEMLSLMHKVEQVHAENHPELHEVARLLEGSLEALEEHLQKEEQVLFPYMYEMYAAIARGERPQPFHCGSIAMPINVMEAEHDGEGERYRHIAALTNNYTAPADACASYRLLLDKIKTFEANLHEHIHLENNIIFPDAIAVEAASVA
jgi:iron-sulfur cluster repair di-iron protein